MLASHCGRRALPHSLGFSRACASSTNSTRTTSTPAQYPRADALNASLSAHPATTIGCLVAAEIGSIYGTYLGLSALHVHVGSAFAMAFALNRALRRVKTPVDMVVAAGLAQAFPFLSRIRLAPVFVAARERFVPGREIGARTQRVLGVLDRYGAAYFLAARWTGVASTALIYAGLRAGVDVDALLHAAGLSAATGAVLGTWAAAVVGSAALFPLTSYVGGALVAPRVARALQRV